MVPILTAPIFENKNLPGTAKLFKHCHKEIEEMKESMRKTKSISKFCSIDKINRLIQINTNLIECKEQLHTYCMN